VDILWPKMCLGCGKEGRYICDNCEVFLSESEMLKVGPSTLKPRIMSLWEYEGVIEKAILKIKYEGCYDIIGELMDNAFQKIDLNLPKDTAITFVPMFRKREKLRGFNQAELIARKIGEATGKSVVRLLEKVRDNRSQVGLDPQERAANVRGVFETLKVGPSTFKPRSVLVVDDVYTTGSTMGECLKVLRRAGVKEIYGFTLARKLFI